MNILYSLIASVFKHCGDEYGGGFGRGSFLHALFSSPTFFSFLALADLARTWPIEAVRAAIAAGSARLSG